MKTSEYVVLGEIVDNQCLDLAFKLGGVRIEGAGALQRLVTSTMNKARQNHSTTLVQDLPVPAMCASVYHHISNQQGGGATTADLMPSHRIRWMTEASF